MSFSLIASLAKVFTSRSDEESALHTSPEYIRTHFPFPLYIFFFSSILEKVEFRIQFRPCGPNHLTFYLAVYVCLCPCSFLSIP